jgi:hypothetical protein
MKGRVLTLGGREVNIRTMLDQVQGNLIVAQYCRTLQRSHAILEGVHKVLFLETIVFVFIFFFLILDFDEFTSRKICFGCSLFYKHFDSGKVSLTAC